MLRAHPLSLPYNLRAAGISLVFRPCHIPQARGRRRYTTATAMERPKDTPPTLGGKEGTVSPAAIVSAIHQHIAFGVTPRDIGNPNMKEKARKSTLDSTLRKEDNTRVHGFVKPLHGKSTSVGLPLKYRTRIPTSTTADLEALADDLETHAMTSADALPRIYHKQNLRLRLLVVLATTQDAASAWAAYRALLVLPRSADKARPKVPFAHRHRLLRLLAAAPRPRPRGRFAQVLAVLRALHDAGGTVQRWEWNLLLDCVGKEGWRCPREDQFRAALNLLADMRGGRDETTGEGGAGNNHLARALVPDLYSYSTLLAHAVRLGSPQAVRHAMRLLCRAGLSPGVHAYTALLCFFARREDLAGVRDTLFRMRQRDQDQGLAQVPFNAVLWAFAYNGRLDVARAMYRVVCARLALPPQDQGEEEHEEETREEEEEEGIEAMLAEREMVLIAREVVPDTATYHILIQAYAYHGDLRGCLETLADMLSSSSTIASTSQLAAFRAIFLGFARHGVSSSSTTTTDDRLEWTLPTLEALFARFLHLELSPGTRPREHMFFWLVSAFMRTSGNDADVLRRVFERVEGRFGYVWTLGGPAGRLVRLRKLFISS